MNLKQILCHISTFGKHKENVIWFPWDDPKYKYLFTKEMWGDHYCTDCEYYLYTVYSFKESLRELRNSYKMWWESSKC